MFYLKYKLFFQIIRLFFYSKNLKDHVTLKMTLSFAITFFFHITF